MSHVTGEPSRGYVGGNPLNFADPTGMLGMPRLPSLGDLWDGSGGQLVSAANDVLEIDVGSVDFGTIAAATVNVGYGLYKVGTGLGVMIAGTAALPIPGVGPLVRAAAYAYGAYQNHDRNREDGARCSPVEFVGLRRVR